MNLFTPEEVAARLNVEPRTVRDWLRTGKLKGLKAGRQWRVDETALVEFLQANYPGDPQDVITRMKLLRLSDEDSQRVTSIAVEHTQLAKEAAMIHTLSPDKAQRVAEINKKIEELRKERDEIINGVK